MRRAEQCCIHNKISDCAVLKLKCIGDAVLFSRTDKLKAGFAVSPCRSYSSEELWSFCRKVNSLKTDFGFCRLFTNCSMKASTVSGSLFNMRSVFMIQSFPAKPVMAFLRFPECSCNKCQSGHNQINRLLHQIGTDNEQTAHGDQEEPVAVHFFSQI